MVSNKDGTYGKPAVNSRILQLQMEFEFPEESLEAKMKRVKMTGSSCATASRIYYVAD